MRKLQLLQSQMQLQHYSCAAPQRHLCRLLQGATSADLKHVLKQYSSAAPKMWALIRHGQSVTQDDSPTFAKFGTLLAAACHIRKNKWSVHSSLWKPDNNEPWHISPLKIHWQVSVLLNLSLYVNPKFHFPDGDQEQPSLLWCLSEVTTIRIQQLALFSRQSNAVPVTLVFGTGTGSANGHRHGRCGAGCSALGRVFQSV